MLQWKSRLSGSCRAWIHMCSISLGHADALYIISTSTVRSRCASYMRILAFELMNCQLNLYLGGSDRGGGWVAAAIFSSNGQRSKHRVRQFKYNPVRSKMFSPKWEAWAWIGISLPSGNAALCHYICLTHHQGGGGTMALSVLFHHRLLLDIIRPPDVTDDEKDSSEISAQDPQKAKKI